MNVQSWKGCKYCGKRIASMTKKCPYCNEYLYSQYGLKENRNEEIRGLYRQGMTYEVIGERFGITRQRVHQICKGGQS